MSNGDLNWTANYIWGMATYAWVLSSPSVLSHFVPLLCQLSFQPDYLILKPRSPCSNSFIRCSDMPAYSPARGWTNIETWLPVAPSQPSES